MKLDTKQTDGPEVTVAFTGKPEELRRIAVLLSSRTFSEWLFEEAEVSATNVMQNCQQMIACEIFPDRVDAPWDTAQAKEAASYIQDAVETLRDTELL